MAKVIALTNQKGGVAKTTNAINLADAFRHKGYKVLFIDMDPQCNSTAVYNAVTDNVNTIVDVLKGDCKAEDAIQHTLLGDIIAGDTLLNQEEMFFNSQKAREGILRRRIRNISELYDYIFIDTPPNLGIYMIMSLSAANGCIVSIKAEKFAIDGLGLLIKTMNEVVEAGINEDLYIYGVLLSMYDRRNSLDRQIWESLPQIGENSGFRIFKTPIRIDQNIKNTQAISLDENVARSLFDLYPKCNAVSDYIEVANEIIGGN